MKKLIAVLVILLCIIACNKIDLEEPAQMTVEDFSQEVEQLMLPPNLNRTPIDKSHINNGQNKVDYACKGCPPPPPPYCFIGNWPTPICNLWDTLRWSGPDKINIVFVAEGFNLTQSGEDMWDEDGFWGYNKMIDSIHQGIFTYEPFTGRENDFNVFSYRTASNEVGVSVINSVDPGDDVTKDTYWNVYRGQDSIARLTTIPDDDRDNLYDDLVKQPNGYLSGEKVYAVLLVNDGVYAGTGEFTPSGGNASKLTAAIWSRDTEFNSFIALFIHEFGGHSLGDRDDEYIDEHFTLGGDDKRNVPRAPINDQQWAPTNYTANGDKFWEGARYEEFGVFKSTEGYDPTTCIPCGFMMERVDKNFSELNQELLDAIIDDES